MKVVVAAFNQEKALVGASVITNLQMELFESLVSPELPPDVLLYIVSCSGTITFNYQSWRHAAAAWHGTTQTAVNNSEGFMIGDHMYCARHTSGDI